ncbi:MAG: GLPGLI family protein [Flavobacteriales bacterium]|jgi:GLPGLI family protein
MKKIALALLGAAIFFGSTQQAVAQKKIKEGKVTYDLSFPELPEEAQAMAGMFPNKMELCFNKQFSRVEMKGGMANNITITDIEKNITTSLMNIMGQKTATETDLSAGAEKDGDIKFDIQKEDGTKDILGYTCKKAIIKTDNGNMEVYYTNEIEINATTQASKAMEGLDGFALEYSLTAQGMKMLLTVTAIDKGAQDPELFKIPAGYKKMTLEEMQKSMGGGF